jgi:hypothetical protein
MRRELFKGFGGTRTTSTETNSDYTIRYLPGLLTLGDMEISRLVWNAVSGIGENCMYAHHAPNREYECRRTLSTLAVVLQKSAWIQSVSAELAENHLALCPNCCAKWQNANSTADAELRKALTDNDSLEVSVTLASQVIRLRFVQIHIEDLRTIFDALAEDSS